MPKTFAELETSELVSFEEFNETLTDYANGGWAISHRVAQKILEKMAEISEEQANELVQVARQGMKKQQDRHQTRAAYEYKRLAEYLETK